MESQENHDETEGSQGGDDEQVDEEEIDMGSDENDESIYQQQQQYVPLRRNRLVNVEPEESTYNCELCPKTFDRKEYYRRHYRRAHIDDQGSSKKQSIFQCDFCGKISTSQDDYDEHQKEHDGEPRFKCRKCEKIFASKEEARKHLAENHTVEDKPFSCETCSKCFKNRYQLILHNRTHTGNFKISIFKKYI